MQIAVMFAGVEGDARGFIGRMRAEVGEVWQVILPGLAVKRPER